MSTPWISSGDVEPSETIRSIAESYKASSDPVVIAERAAAARADREAKRMSAIQAQMDAGGADPRTSAEILAGMAHHDAGYDDPRAKRFLPSAPGPKIADEPTRQPSMEDLINRAVKELGVPRAKAEKMALLWLHQRA